MYRFDTLDFISVFGDKYVSHVEALFTRTDIISVTVNGLTGKPVAAKAPNGIEIISPPNSKQLNLDLYKDGGQSLLFLLVWGDTLWLYGIKDKRLLQFRNIETELQVYQKALNAGYSHPAIWDNGASYVPVVADAIAILIFSEKPQEFYIETEEFIPPDLAKAIRQSGPQAKKLKEAFQGFI